MANIFVKRNPLPKSDALACEAHGLEELRSVSAKHGLNIPKVLQLTESELHLETINRIEPTAEDWRRLGRGLAALHSITTKNFGYSSPNFIGLNRQINTPHDNWGEFFVERRLRFQMELLRDKKLRDDLLTKLEKVKSRLIDFLNAHRPQPSLLHGDLWSGNVMFSAEGPWLIDPAVYYGDRETDLAMTRMFGGFSDEFYAVYENVAPLPDGCARRESIYNLYHYLNHLNLFGQSYMGGVNAGMKVIESL